MKFTLNPAKRTYGWRGLRGWVYNEKKDFRNATVAYTKTSIAHGRLINNRSDIVYHILSGNGNFYLDNKRMSVRKGDVVVVPKKTVFDFKPSKNSTLILLVIHLPSFDPKDERRLDE
jgi:mannose-6-phosphate isomerase-like protein (cupin superfamily)